MNREANKKMNPAGEKRLSLAQAGLVLLCLTVCFLSTALPQDRDQPYVVSKEGRRYPVEPVGSYLRRLEAARSQATAEQQSPETAQTLSLAVTPTSYSLAVAIIGRRLIGFQRGS